MTSCSPNIEPAKNLNTDSIALLHSKLLASKDTVIYRDTIKNNGDGPPLCQMENPDTVVYEIVLDDVQSSVEKLGQQWKLMENYTDMPHQNFVSNDGKQFLTTFFHYGGVKFEYSEFQVSYLCKESIIDTLNTNTFVSGNGIELGMNRESVGEILGNCYEVDTVNRNEILKYTVDDYSNSGLLKRYNMPVYYAHYEFKEDKLIRFRFGFEYP